MLEKKKKSICEIGFFCKGGVVPTRQAEKGYHALLQELCV